MKAPRFTLTLVAAAVMPTCMAGTALSQSGGLYAEILGMTDGLWPQAAPT